jgi:hypothetical protein
VSDYRLQVYTVDGGSKEYVFLSEASRTRTMDFVSATWKANRPGSLALTDPEGNEIRINTAHIVRMKALKT